ncbi:MULTISPECIES: hypothetical protein [unclassified Lentimonas]|uniref:hypothetical protein n=1 Tax=unclassified Lentimonas TaxID=2630993 RepID=UPI0013236724|nr:MULTISPECIES: hypothetical protein [unclassified Lentimonas]CAA6680117.1 Unannotated [Lentimonas sp. CC4]CAA6685097.1 Unannotated [Lentimonas sp. CC6]CAA6696647.1 Unannotated [Lentimonas sp. CC10]CAA6697380.1 Unannotated [Lentimonas sp. CC19]CAA7072464.1 Unannotated [Lentimonas sp. CC11]
MKENTKNDWDAFIEDVPWFLQSDQVVTINNPTKHLPPSTEFKKTFPTLSNLLSLSRRTEITIDSAKFDLFAWNSNDGLRMGWLCPQAEKNTNEGLHKYHSLLLSIFGGTIERFNEPQDSWLLNHEGVLTAEEASDDASFIEDSLWAFENDEIPLPVVLSEFYTVAREANGNVTLCHRDSGDILLFAQDHCYDHVTPLGGCPEYTFYTINDTPTFIDWVEAIARQWQSHITKS